MGLKYTTARKHYSTLHYTALHYTTLHYTTLHYPYYTTPQLQLQLRHTNYTTPQLELQLHYTTLHPAVVGEVTDQVTTATIAATPKNTAPTTFRSISGFALSSMHHNNLPLL